MPVELFGFSFGRSAKGNNVSNATTPPANNSKTAQSFVAPELDDAYFVDAGGYFGTYVDLDGSLP